MIVACLRLLLSTFLAVTAALKLMHGHDKSIWIGPTVYHGIIVAEFVLALGILSWRRGAVVTAVLAVLFFAVAVVVQFVLPSGGHCGCLGSIRLSRAHQMLIAACAGLLACGYLRAVTRRETRAAQTSIAT